MNKFSCKEVHYEKILCLIVAFIIVFVLCGCSKSKPDIDDLYINDEGNLVINFIDGTSQDLGRVRGSDGKDGMAGKDGKDGQATSRLMENYKIGHKFKCFPDTPVQMLSSQDVGLGLVEINITQIDAELTYKISQDDYKNNPYKSEYDNYYFPSIVEVSITGYLDPQYAGNRIWFNILPNSQWVYMGFLEDQRINNTRINADGSFLYKQNCCWLEAPEKVYIHGAIVSRPES